LAAHRTMAPIVERAAEQALHLLTLHRRNLDVSSTQKVTLGIIAVYVVVIAILWNIPYVSKVLWPFKVGPPLRRLRPQLTPGATRCSSSPSTSSPTRSPACSPAATPRRARSTRARA